MKKIPAPEVRIGDLIAAKQVRGRVRKIELDYIQPGYVRFDIELPEGGTRTVTGKMSDEIGVEHRPFKGSEAAYHALLNRARDELDRVDDQLLRLRSESEKERAAARAQLRNRIGLLQAQLETILLSLEPGA